MAGEILIHCRSYTQSSIGVRVGLTLAQRLEARANGLFVVSLYPAAFATPETVALTLTAASREYEDALATTGFWRDQCEAAGVSGRWLVSEDDPVEALARAALLSDLLVMERPGAVADAPTGWGLVSRTVFASSSPVLVVPDSAARIGCGANVLVAWNGSRESARALIGALPVMRTADRIVVLDGCATDNGGRRLSPPPIRPWFERAGLDIEYQPFAPEGGAGQALLAAAREHGSDLVVMGAWGHSRLAELILGGATRYLFTHSELPMLVAH